MLGYFYFPQKTGFGISCKFSICIKCQILFSGGREGGGGGENDIIQLSSVELVQRPVMVKLSVENVLHRHDILLHKKQCRTLHVLTAVH